MKLFILLAYLFFMVPDTGKTLQDFRWENRVLIVNFEKSVSDSLLVANENKFEERKLLFVEFNNGKFIRTTGPEAIDSADFLKVLSRTDRRTEWVLIGLDGGVKDSGTFENFSLQQLLVTIDQMPMRISEMKGKNGGK